MKNLQLKKLKISSDSVQLALSLNGVLSKLTEVIVIGSSSKNSNENSGLFCDEYHLGVEFSEIVKQGNPELTQN